MPCYYHETPEEIKAKARYYKGRDCEELLKVEAMLCAFIKGIEARDLSWILEAVDWKDVGVTRNEFEEWWLKHHKADQERIQKEKVEKVLEKLTPEEQELIKSFKWK